MKSLKAIVSFLGMLTMTACSVFGEADIEKPDYKIMAQEQAFEIREYPALLAVSTYSEGSFNSASNRSFRRLFDYITGENKPGQKVEMTAPVIMQPKGQKIPMTAPVLMQQQDERWKMSFLLPAEFNIETAPAPSNAAVFLEPQPAQKFAVITFSGVLKPPLINQKHEELMIWLEKGNYTYDKSAYQVAGYNPPWTMPSLRRNEILIVVTGGPLK